MSASRAVALALGALCGWLAAAPVRHESGTPEPPRTAPCPTGLGGRRPDDQGERDAHLAEASAREARRAFEDTWGAPPTPPPGWDPEVQAADLVARASATGADGIDVDCDHFPCLVHLAARGPLDAEAIAAFDVDPGAIRHLSSGGRHAWVGTAFPVGVAAELDPLAARWIDTRLDRQHLLIGRVVADLDASEPEAPVVP